MKSQTVMILTMMLIQMSLKIIFAISIEILAIALMVKNVNSYTKKKTIKMSRKQFVTSSEIRESVLMVKNVNSYTKKKTIKMSPEQFVTSSKIRGNALMATNVNFYTKKLIQMNLLPSVISIEILESALMAKNVNLYMWIKMKPLRKFVGFIQKLAVVNGSRASVLLGNQQSSDRSQKW